MNRKEIKREAKEFAFKNKWNMWKPILVFMAIGFVFGLVTELMGIGPKYAFVEDPQLGVILQNTNPSIIYDILEIVLSIAMIPISIGYIWYILCLIRGHKIELKEMFTKYFKFTLKIFCVELVIGLLACLWSILFIIPGIIFAYKMAMSQFILADEVDENTKVKAVMNKSKEMMDGHKMDLFVFQLSFIGWFFLVGITFGIAAIWVVPYYNVASTMYYEKLKALKN